MNLDSMDHVLCKCCATIAQYVEAHLDPSGSLLAASVTDHEVEEIVRKMNCTEAQEEALREYVKQHCNKMKDWTPDNLRKAVGDALAGEQEAYAYWEGCEKERFIRDAMRANYADINNAVAHICGLVRNAISNSKDPYRDIEVWRKGLTQRLTKSENSTNGTIKD